MKKLSAIILVCLLLTSLIFGGCSDNEPSEIANETTSTDVTDSDVSSYDTGSYGIANFGNVSLSSVVPDDLLLGDFDTLTLKYIKGVDLMKNYFERKNEETTNKKKEILRRFFETAGITTIPEFTTDVNYRVECITDDGVTVSCSGIGITITPKTEVLNNTSTDEEILNYIKTDKYLNALAVMSGVDTNNMTVHHETEAFGETQAQSYSVYTKTDSVEDRAFNTENHRISFQCYLSQTEKTVSGITWFAGSIVADNTVHEITVNKEAYEKALSKAAAELVEQENIALAKDSSYQKRNISVDNMRCRLVYNYLVKPGYKVPVFRFFFKCDDGTVLRNEVPCVDASEII